MKTKCSSTTMQPNNLPTRIVRIRELCSRTGYSRSMVFEKTNPDSKYYDPAFPRRIPLGARAMGFLDSEIDAWIQSRVDRINLQKEA